MGRAFKFHNPHGVYFISTSVINWISIFVREKYFESLITNLDYCRKNKGMEIYAYCIMPNHFHLIFRSREVPASSLIRDFKTYTSKQLFTMISENKKESRKDWITRTFNFYGLINPSNKNHQFWQNANHPIELWSYAMFEQKRNYIHQNPVKAGFVNNPEDWKYSSARNYGLDDDSILEIDRT